MGERLLRYMDDIEDRLIAFAGANNLQIVRQIGFGIHGRVFMIIARHSASVVKVFEEEDPYKRERDVYLRLQEKGVEQIVGCHVPDLLSFSDDLRVVHISLVSRPFCLDFAAAYLDALPIGFPPMESDWEAEKLKEFGTEDWLKASLVLDRLKSFGIIQTDVSPTNISV